MLEKFGNQYDDFAALFGYGPGGAAEKQEEAPPQSDPEPESWEMDEEENPYADFVQSSTPIDLDTPIQEKPVVEEKPRSGFGDFVSPEDLPAPDPKAEWEDKEFLGGWSLPRRGKEPPVVEGLFDDFVTPEDIAYPERKAKPEPKPEPLEPQNDLSNFDTAKDYLMSFEGKDPAFDLVSNGLVEVLNVLSSKHKRGKTVANAIGFVIGAIEALLRKPDVLGKDKDQITQAANTIKDFYNDYVAKLSPELHENVNQQIIRQVEGPKPRPLQRRSSKFHGENIIFVQNRAIEIMRDEGATSEQAEAQAQEDWNGIVETVNSNGGDFQPGDLATFRSMFAKSMLGGNSYEDAQQYIVSLMERGPAYEDKFYEGIDADVSQEDLMNSLQGLTDTGSVEEEIEDLPEEYVQKLTPKIAEFAELSANLLKVGADWEERIKRQQEMPIELQDQIQQVYNRAIALSGEISTTPPDIKAQAFEGGKIFKDVFIATANINKYVDTFGIEQVDQSDPLGVGEAIEADLTVIDPTKKPLTEEEKKLPRKARVRDKEKARKHDRKYMQLIRLHGDVAGYYKPRAAYTAYKEPAMVGRGDERRKETQEEFEARRNWQKEHRRIVNSDYNRAKDDDTDWRSLGLSKGNQQEGVTKVINRTYRYVNKFWENIYKTWLPDEKKQKIIDLRLNGRMNMMKSALEHIESYPMQTNTQVADALRKVIQEFPTIWEQGRERAQALQVTESQRWHPGEWNERMRQEGAKKRKQSLSKTLSLVDLFYKNALIR